MLYGFIYFYISNYINGIIKSKEWKHLCKSSCTYSYHKTQFTYGEPFARAQTDDSQRLTPSKWTRETSDSYIWGFFRGLFNSRSKRFGLLVKSGWKFIEFRHPGLLDLEFHVLLKHWWIPDPSDSVTSDWRRANLIRDLIVKDLIIEQ